MNPKVKMEKDAAFIFGMVLGILGGIFLALGILFGVLLGSEGLLACLVFVGVGGVFFLIGLLCFRACRKKQRRMQKLLEEGRYLWGEIVECAPNLQISVNGRHPTIATARYLAPDGTEHLFQSRNLYHWRPENGGLLHQQVKIYIEDGNMDNYYVAVEELLPGNRAF